MIPIDISKTEYLGLNKKVNKISPLVSVCIITYNHEKFIHKCLNSILSQKIEYLIEIIIGEDNSTDKTRNICIDYANKYQDKIRLFLRTPGQKIKVNGTESFHFNFIEALNSCRGKYIAFCEGDDYWIDDNKLRKQVDFLESDKKYIASAHKTSILANGKIIHDTVFCDYLYDTLNLSDLITTNCTPFHISSFIYRKESANFRTDFLKTICGDRALFCLVGSNGPVKYMNFKGSIYRKHEGGMTNTPIYQNLMNCHMHNIEMWTSLSKEFESKPLFNKVAQKKLKQVIFFYRIARIKIWLKSKLIFTRPLLVFAKKISFLIKKS